MRSDNNKCTPSNTLTTIADVLSYECVDILNILEGTKFLTLHYFSF